MTEEEGDELAAHEARRLQNLAESVALSHRGRVGKLLGDGVMLRFERSVSLKGIANLVTLFLATRSASPSA